MAPVFYTAAIKISLAVISAILRIENKYHYALSRPQHLYGISRWVQLNANQT